VLRSQYDCDEEGVEWAAKMSLEKERGPGGASVGAGVRALRRYGR